MNSADLPTGWVRAPFSEVAIIASNLVDPKPRAQSPHIAPDNIEPHTGRLLPYRTVGEDEVTSPKHSFREGQILYSKIRPYLNKCVRASFSGLCSADMYPVDALIDTAYLHLQMLSQSFVQAVSAAAGSRTILPKTNQEQLADVPISVAPLREQRSIVEIVDRHLTRLDAAAEGLKRVEANLKRYRASVLKAAVEGRLVPTEAELAKKEGRPYEPASVLLARILEERRRRWEESELAEMKAKGGVPKNDKWKEKYEEPGLVSVESLPAIPEGWCWTTAEALTDPIATITYGVVKLGPECEGGIPTLRSSNVRQLRLDLEYVKPISAHIAREYRRTSLNGGEVVVTVRGTLGGVAVVPPECRGFNVSREVAVMKLVAPEVGPVLAALIASPNLDRWIRKNTKGNTYVGINIEDLKRLPVPLPPVAEQSRIAAAVVQSLGAGEETLKEAQRSHRRLQRLRQSILKWAFEGKLVDQDPNDEPASVLLARIKAERAAADSAPTKPARGRRARQGRPDSDDRAAE